MRRSLLFIVTALIAGPWACKRAPSAAPVAVLDAAAQELAATPRDAGTGTDGGGRPKSLEVKITPEERARNKAYLDALNEGRSATRKKHYKEAIAAFDRAAKLKPYTARAYAEKGYAELLAGKFKAAEDDL